MATSKDPQALYLCAHCNKIKEDHGDNGKCLFMPTRFLLFLCVGCNLPVAIYATNDYDRKYKRCSACTVPPWNDWDETT